MRVRRKKVPAVDPHARRFGVEIECGLPHGYDKAVELFDGAYDPDEEDDYGRWTVGEDGTMVEIRTPILQGPEGFETLRWAMDLIKSEGGYVTAADGLHVHHDAPEFASNPEACLRLVDSWRNNQALIHGMVAPRRSGSGACPSWSNTFYESLRGWAASGGAGRLYATRNDLNLSVLRNYGSVEIRLHEGTLDADVAIAWIMFGQRFIHEVAQNLDPLANAETDENLLVNIQLSDEAKAVLAAKKANGHITDASRYRGYS